MANSSEITAKLEALAKARAARDQAIQQVRAAKLDLHKALSDPQTIAGLPKEHVSKLFDSIAGAGPHAW